MLTNSVLVDELAHQHVDEDHVGRVDKRDVLPALQQQGSVDCPQPHDGVPGLEMPQPVAASTQELPKTLEQFGGGGLYHRLLGAVSVGARSQRRHTLSLATRLPVHLSQYHVVVVVLQYGGVVVPADRGEVVIGGGVRQGCTL